MPTDELLKYIIKSADETGIGSSITLSINGTIISGIIIRPKVYYDEMAEEFDNWKHVGRGGHNKERWENYKKEYKEFINRFRNKEEGEIMKDSNIDYIHLKDVKIWKSDMSYPLPLWRGKLASIDGFCLGALQEA